MLPDELPGPVSDQPAAPLWQYRALGRRYGRQEVLSDVSFSLRQGEVLGLFGPNGSGKSTLLDILALAIRPSTGSILFHGEDVLSRVGQVRPLIGYVPQDIALFEELTVMDNLLCWSRLPARQTRARVAEIAGALCLGDISGQKVATLSGGMKRRVNLGVALLGSPSLLVLDEPFAGVDLDHRGIMQTLLRQLTGLGVSQVISSHSLEDILPLADKIMVLREGHVLFYDDLAVFRQRTAAADGQPHLAFRAILDSAAATRPGQPPAGVERP
jgi:ABC-2 type transport system ATP-binding protein